MMIDAQMIIEAPFAERQRLGYPLYFLTVLDGLCDGTSSPERVISELALHINLLRRAYARRGICKILRFRQLKNGRYAVTLKVPSL